MSRLLKQDVTELLSASSDVCVSIYAPMIVAGPEVQQNSIRFKNLLKSAQQQVDETDAAESVTDKLKRLEKLVDDNDFWQHQSQGLAIFVDDDDFRIMALPREFEERVVVGHRFHVTPLLPLVQNDGVFYIVAVSQNECRLFMATRHTIRQVPADLPDSLKAVMGSEHQKGFMLHSFKVRRRSSDSAVPHGHVESNERAELLRYFREIDAGVTEAISDPETLLVFAGVGEHMPVYEEANTHKGLMQHCLHGNPDDSTPEQLHARAWEYVGPHIRRRADALLSQLGTAASEDLCSHDREEIAHAAKTGRVDTLLISVPQPDNDPSDVDRVVEQLVAAVFENGGSVVIVDEDQLSDSKAAALMRYPSPVESA